LYTIGKFVYRYVGHFREGLAQVENDGEWFHIQHDGSPAYEARFDEVGHFRGGLAWAKKDGWWFKIRPDGSRAVD
jgi:hypothetical protein